MDRHPLTALPPPGGLPFDDVIDVRSPAEFAEDHVPGAINLPALDDAERARVGTVYVREDRFLARKLGAAMVARNVAAHLEGPLSHRGGGWRPLVYCWRGGQRSGSVATILDAVGWRVAVLEGGYRTYRRLVARRLYEEPLGPRVVLIDGGTGSGKTQLIGHLAAQGAQAIDLEGLAGHRGSIFGGWDAAQPSQKMFESRLAAALTGLDPARPLFLEAESNAIGRLLLPPALWRAMGEAEVVALEVPPAARARFLTEAYPDLTEDADRLRDRIDRLRRYQPRERIEAWHALAAQGRFAELAETPIADHYDPRYASPARARRAVTATLALDGLGAADLASAAERVLARTG